MLTCIRNTLEKNRMKKSLTSNWEATRTNADDFKKASVSLVNLQPKELKARPLWGMCTCMFKAALFTTDQERKQPWHPLPDDWTKIMKYMHTMQYYSAFKEGNPITSTWISFENIMLSQLNQSQKVKYCDSTYTGI